MRVLELGCGTGNLLAQLKPSYGLGVDFSPRMIEVAKRNHRDLEFVVGDVEDASFISNWKARSTISFYRIPLGIWTISSLYFVRCARFRHSHTRLMVSYYSHLWEPALALAEGLGRKMPQPGVNFLSSSDITNLLYLAGFEVVRTEWRQLIPKRLLGIGTLLNRYPGTLPPIRRLCLRHYIVARPFARRR